MAFYDSASAKSLWRGYDYYCEGKVARFEVRSDHEIVGHVQGSDGAEYEVSIDVDHPRRSTCNCPFADGRRVVCKHMVALYFTSVPNSEDDFLADMEQRERDYEAQEERYREERLAEITASVKAMSAKEARERLIELLYQDFLRDRYRNDYW